LNEIKTVHIMKKILSFVIMAAMFASCVSSKKYKEASARNKKLEDDNKALQMQLYSCHDSNTVCQTTNRSLRDQLDAQKGASSQMLEQLKDLSVISNSQAESIKKSLENINSKDAYIRNLQSAIQRKDSLTQQLILNLKGAIGNLNDKDINIKVDKGVVYIDISDKMLFKTGKWDVTDQARDVLGKVAKVLLAQPDIEFMVEGHTDNVPFHEGVLEDNWDLSVKRATSVIRILQNQYNIPPARMTAAGRGEYVPVGTNDTEEGRAANRRTRIVILPQLDQFFKLLEKPAQ
jgi:chemotaxis protein MotB